METYTLITATLNVVREKFKQVSQQLLKNQILSFHNYSEIIHSAQAQNIFKWAWFFLYMFRNAFQTITALLISNQAVIQMQRTYPLFSLTYNTYQLFF